MIVYLADLSHITDGRLGAENIPLGIGYLSAYLQHHKPDELKVRLFKEPERLSAALEEQPPAIMGFSCQLWNIDLSCQVAALIKTYWPEVMIVFGGPNFPIDTKAQAAWLRQRPYIDLYIEGEGERDLLSLCEAVRYPDWREQIDELPNARTLYRGHLIASGHQRADGSRQFQRVEELDSYPSPYLTGLLDEFLADPRIMPLVEGTRGCPFTCTYCVDGNLSRSPVRRHTLARRVAEVEYIAERTKNKTLQLADSNFGMLAEDELFSQALARLREQADFPHYIISSMGKNNKARLRAVAGHLRGALRIAASLQSTDREVLHHIRRTNISQEELAELALHPPEQVSTYSELILGLPGDTRTKHLRGIMTLIDLGFDQVRLNQLILLDGTVVATQRQQFHLETCHRVLQRSFGAYTFLGQLLRSVEWEEVVVGGRTEQSVFAREDYLYCRLFGFTTLLFYTERVLFELVGYVRSLGVLYAAFVQALHEEILAELDSDSADPILEVYRRFRKAAEEELHPEGPVVTDRLWTDLQAGEAGNNLNYNNLGHVLVHQYETLCRWAFRAVAQYLQAQQVSYDPDYLTALAEYCILKKGALPSLISSSGVPPATTWSASYDFLAQERQGFTAAPVRLAVPATYSFTFEPWQVALFQTQLAMFGSTDVGLGKLITRSSLHRLGRRALELNAGV